MLLHSVGTDNKVLPKSSPVFHKSEGKWNEKSYIKAFFQQKLFSLATYCCKREEILHLTGFFMMIFPCSNILSTILNLA